MHVFWKGTYKDEKDNTSVPKELTVYGRDRLQERITEIHWRRKEQYKTQTWRSGKLPGNYNFWAVFGYIWRRWKELQTQSSLGTTADHRATARHDVNKLEDSDQMHHLSLDILVEPTYLSEFFFFPVESHCLKSTHWNILITDSAGRVYLYVLKNVTQRA